MDVLLSTTLGASRDSIGEHGTLVAAASHIFAGQQLGNALNATIMSALLCEFII